VFLTGVQEGGVSYERGYPVTGVFACCFADLLSRGEEATAWTNSAGDAYFGQVIHPTPCTLHPAPCTLNPAPCTLHPAPYTLQGYLAQKKHPPPRTLA